MGIEELEALRVPLTGYCYRLLGSSADADDAVQETLIRASSRRDQYDPGRARLSTWVHRIATNVCIDMLRAAKRRALVMDAGPATSENFGLGAPLPPEVWVEPMPDSRVLDVQNPGDVVLERESVRLAFIAALQHLAPRQRAVLVLRDVLVFSARETAEILGTTVPAVNSALQRARAALEANRPDPFDLYDPEDAGQRDLLRRYVAAFESHDIAGLTALMREDAVASMPPFQWRLDGAREIAAAAGSSDSCAGARLVLCRINGAPGFGQYRPGDDGVLRPFALVSVDIRDGLLTQLVTFLGTQHRFAEFGLPEFLRDESGSPCER
ncbi:sigma-70 family RNA polymerase sigma factor [Actinomadura sp. KC06]|uniref:RNA polymerase subunit sigma-70 n=1 Tax=Actinomadura sp. KC06 TaxID=2530369 RepID=UPI00104B9855|nr:RNA polymerase subunit sigma-70 [Actinomadura sp. KC06]TDD38331.1 sigma-70 family RNA polymerase sigma factor [Actinomadura sp. KC06]